MDKISKSLNYLAINVPCTYYIELDNKSIKDHMYIKTCITMTRDKKIVLTHYYINNKTHDLYDEVDMLSKGDKDYDEYLDMMIENEDEIEEETFMDENHPPESLISKYFADIGGDFIYSYSKKIKNNIQNSYWYEHYYHKKNEPQLYVYKVFGGFAKNIDKKRKSPSRSRSRSRSRSPIRRRSPSRRPSPKKVVVEKVVNLESEKKLKEILNALDVYKKQKLSFKPKKSIRKSNKKSIRKSNKKSVRKSNKKSVRKSNKKKVKYYAY